MAYTQLPPVELPAGMLGEGYAQAGYVGGRDATAFADGQMRAERVIAESTEVQFRTGAGAWAGAQKGASRLDVGPTATMQLSLPGIASARLSADWRVRVAGNASPGSGPALTLSAGF
jgi:hypothetical protein